MYVHETSTALYKAQGASRASHDQRLPGQLPICRIGKDKHPRNPRELATLRYQTAFLPVSRQ